MLLEAGALLLPVVMAISAGLVGCFAVMRRMALAADALSHVALPGIGLALVLGGHPLHGAVAALFAGAVLIWALEARARVATETVIGVVFSASLAAGSLLSSGEELIESLLGGTGELGPLDLAFGLVAAGAVITFVLLAKDRLIVALVSPEIAATAGIRVRRLDLGFLLAFALTLAVGLRYLGVLLMGSLLIIPAATARRLSSSLAGMLVSAVAVAVLSTVAGSLLAARLGREGGPLIISVATACFLASLVRRRS